MELYEINNYNFKEVKNSVLNHFNNYRFYKNRINLIEARIKCALNSDNLGIFSNKKNDFMARIMGTNAKKRTSRKPEIPYFSMVATGRFELSTPWV